MYLKKFTNALSDILGFEVEIKNDKVKINQWLDFWSYKINNWFKKDFEEVLQKAIGDIEKLQDDNEKVYKWILDFFALYYKWWDFGYFKSRFDSFKYRIPYSGKDTEFTWSTKDSYFVKTKDVENTIKVWFFENEIEFLKKDDEEKENNEIEVLQKDEQWKIKVIFYNWKRNKNWQGKEISESELKELKEKLEKEGVNIQIDKNFKQLLNDFLKKWWKDYFIHQKLEAFLKEELAYFVYQKIGLEEYIFVKKKAILDFVNEILDLKEKEVLTEQQEEVKKLFDEIQDTDDIYRYYENLQKIKNIIILSSQVEWEKIKLEDVLNFERFSKLKEELEEKKEVLETILQDNTKKIIETFEQVIKDFIEILSQIEEIKKLIWETKKTVIKANYVVSIDKILEAGEDKNFVLGLITQEQINEWKDELKLVEKDFKKEDIFEDEKYLKLPLDTKYLDENKKFELLSRFDDLEEKLDGLLIKSENFQALKTIQDKYKEQVKTIYIDPPYNTWNDGFVYKDNYNHSSWLSMMENRLRLARELMKKNGVIFSSIWKDEFLNQEEIFKIIFFKDTPLIVKKKPNSTMWDEWISNIADFISVWYKSIFKKIWKNIKKIYTDKYWKFVLRNIVIRTDMMYTWMKSSNEDYSSYIFDLEFDLNDNNWVDSIFKQVKIWNKVKYKLPKKRRFLFTKDKLLEYIKKWLIYYNWKELFFKEYNSDYIYKYAFSKVMTKDILDNNLFYNQYWTKLILDIFWYDINWTPKPLELINFLISLLNDNSSIILDFFAWSWTTADAVIRLNQEDWWNRKFILVELNKYFETIILPRIKKVSFWTEWKNWKPDFKNKDAKQAWIFFKYIYLDQYDEILERLDFKDFETNSNEEKNKKKAKKEKFDKKFIYIYNQIINWKKEKDLINTAIYHFNFKEQKYYYNEDYILLETDKRYILKVKTNNLNSLAENLDDKKTIYTSKEDYEKLSDKLKTKVKVLDYLFNYMI